MSTDDELIAQLKARALDPARRRDVKVESFAPLNAVATGETIAAAEAEIGFALPPLLVRIYTEVGNGGFGPGHGLMLLAAPGEADPDSVAAVYRNFRAWSWPEKLLPLWDWGCAAWSCIDAATSEGVIVTHDEVAGAIETAFTLRSWLQSWVSGVEMYKEIFEDQDAIRTNPFTKKPIRIRVRGSVIGKPWRPASHDGD
jgi:hypothetical protein